jgi:hypothetical protein
MNYTNYKIYKNYKIYPGHPCHPRHPCLFPLRFPRFSPIFPAKSANFKKNTPFRQIFDKFLCISAIYA